MRISAFFILDTWLWVDHFNNRILIMAQVPSTQLFSGSLFPFPFSWLRQKWSKPEKGFPFFPKVTEQLSQRETNCSGRRRAVGSDPRLPSDAPSRGAKGGARASWRRRRLGWGGLGLGVARFPSDWCPFTVSLLFFLGLLNTIALGFWQSLVLLAVLRRGQ